MGVGIVTAAGGGATNPRCFFTFLGCASASSLHWQQSASVGWAAHPAATTSSWVWAQPRKTSYSAWAFLLMSPLACHCQLYNWPCIPHNNLKMNLINSHSLTFSAIVSIIRHSDIKLRYPLIFCHDMNIIHKKLFSPAMIQYYQCLLSFRRSSGGADLVVFERAVRGTETPAERISNVSVSIIYYYLCCIVR